MRFEGVGYRDEMTERDPDDIARDEVESDPDQPPGPVPDDERDAPPEEPETAPQDPDLGDFEGNLNA